MYSRTIMLLLCLAWLGGCGIFRGIPSHGGGKRFDEEQRVVAGAIRQTIAQLDLSELRGRRVQIVLECMAGDGGASITFPGFQSINLGGSINDGTNNIVRVSPGERAISIDDSQNKSSGVYGSASYQLTPSYSPHGYSTSGDLTYLKAALEMQARHAGVLLGGGEPEVVLYVLVDVLGTNRSRADYLVVNKERLAASCECTYYALESKSQQLLIRARRASAQATYAETHGVGVHGVAIERQLENTAPMPLPEVGVRSTTLPSSVPASQSVRQARLEF